MTGYREKLIAEEQIIQYRDTDTDTTLPLVVYLLLLPSFIHFPLSLMPSPSPSSASASSAITTNNSFLSSFSIHHTPENGPPQDPNLYFIISTNPKCPWPNFSVFLWEDGWN